MRTHQPHQKSACTQLITVLLPATMCLLSATCGEGEAGAASSMTVEDSAGVRIVRNGIEGLWGDGPPTVTEKLRIGVVDGEDPYQLYQVYSLAMDEDGVLYVGNNQTASVRVFDADGTFVREFGGKGSGPGEYVMVNRVWLAGDRIGVTDWQRGGRTGIYTKEGELVEFWQALQPDGSMIMPTAWTPEGWLASHAPRWEVPQLADGERLERRSGLSLYDPEADTVGPPVVMLPPSVLYGSSQTEGLDWALFQPRSSTGVDAAGRIIMSRGDPYRIEVHRLDGTVARIVTRTYTPVPLGQEDVEQLKALLTAVYDTASYSNAAEQKERLLARVDRQRAFDPRPTLGPTGRLLASPDGSFWIERTDGVSPAVQEFERLYGGFGKAQPRPTRWDLFDDEGRFLTSVDLPARFQPMAVVGTDVAGVLKDEMDVEYVVVYRITR